MSSSRDHFPADVKGLPNAHRPELFELGDADQMTLRIAPVAKRLGDTIVRMLAYNSSIPGPILRVKQGTELAVRVINEGDLEATVHWHGLRVDNRYDGTTQTQRPIPIGGSFTYRLQFPDPGVYWYHPHIREDYGQEMGLYGNIVVVPAETDYWPTVHRELTLTLDDILLEQGRIAPFSRSESTYTAMGRFGNVFLLNGQPDLSLAARHGEVVRFFLTNTANTRVFNVVLPGGRMKLVGGDSGHYERETFVESVLIAPSERAVVDVMFDRPGPLNLEHRTPQRTYALGTITVSDEQVESESSVEFGSVRTNSDMATERERVARYVESVPDKTLALVAEMDMGSPEVREGAALAYTCPMHPEVIRLEEGRCPKCGMKLLPTQTAAIAYACPMHPEVRAAQPEHCPKCGMKLLPAQLVPETASKEHHGEHHEHRVTEGHQDHGGEPADSETDAAAGIEWEDDMVEVNRMTTPANMRWKLIDRATGAEGTAIDWTFRVGDRVKIRLINEMDSDHPMHHPFHIHGAGRFLILSRDGIVEPNFVWKDTVLVPTGQTVDILLEVTNPGLWMAHCHIAEHHEGGMMFSFKVDP
jgi:FtsP/CotA-like multicopper oxidase with cupredoxin domain